MADVEQRAEAEAEKKGLSGKARKSYIGGVFNRIREAHARAVKPGQGKTFLRNLNRRNRQLARARYKEALRPHEEAVAALKSQRKGELAQLSYEEGEKRERKAAPPAPASKPAKPPLTDAEKRERGRAYHEKQDSIFSLKPGTHAKLENNGFFVLEPQVEGGPWTIYREDGKMFRGVNLSGSAGGENGGVRAVNSRQDVEAFADLVAHDPSAITPRTRKAQEDLLIRHARGEMPSLPTEAEKRERGLRNFPRVRDRQIRDAIKHGAPDFPPGTLAAAQGKPAPTGVRLSVRPYTYHGNAGYLISGSDRLGRRISIFARSKSEAERMRDDIKAGRETMFDSERRSGGDGA